MTTTVFKGNSPLIGTRDDLVRHFQDGEKPPERWRVGTEHEKLAFSAQTHAPLTFGGEQGIFALLEGYRTRFGWQAVREGENVIALTRNEASITLEPGGQLELSGAAVVSAHDTAAELYQHRDETRAIAADLGVVMLALGRNPVVPSAQMPWMPKERYAIMGRYLPTRGSRALDMMVGTGTVQTNIDYQDEADMARKLRAAMAVAPFLNALFASSPFEEGRPCGWLSSRGRVWEHTDPDRSGFIPGVFDERFGYREYAEYALDVPMFFIHRNGHYLDYSGRSFRNFLETGLDGHGATLEDWALHLTTLFPHVRVKQYIELRMADVGPIEMMVAFCALTRGLFYDSTALAAVTDLVRPLNAAQFPALMADAAQLGLRAQAAGRPVRAWAEDLVSIARDGLRRLDARNERGEDERIWLAPLDRIVASGQTLADRLLEAWEGPWGRRIDPIFDSELVAF